MLFSSTIFFSLLHCILLLLINADNGKPIRGVPGIDYPNYQTIPHTSFRCSEQKLIPGLYADPETGCQMFHHCYEHRHESFLCPPGTIFNQAILACDYWYSADCSAATPDHKIEPLNKASNIDPKLESARNKNPSINIFSKLASLYDIQEPFTIGDTSKEDTYNYASDNYQDHDNNILSVSNIHDRREGVITETYNDISYSQYEKKNGNQLRMFDNFESSGEPDDSDEHGYSEEKFSSLTDAEKPVDFEKQYFGYDEVENLEYDSEHQINNEELFSHFSDTQNENKSSIYHKSEDTFVKRQSKAIENNIRKQRRRPLYNIIEKEADIKEFTTTENPKQNIDLNLNDTTNSLSYSQDSVSTSNPASTLPASKTKRRKPVLIQLEDSYEYNVNNEKISSIKYGNPQSNIPEFSMDAEEISVKLFPSNTKRKPVIKLMQHQFIETNSNAELKSINSIVNRESNIYGTSTFSTLYDIDSFQDISISQKYPKRKKSAIRIIGSEDNHDVYMKNKELPETTTFNPASYIYSTSTLSTLYNGKSIPDLSTNQKYPKRKKNAIRIIDSEDNNDVYKENKELKETTTFTTASEDYFTAQSTSTNFKDYDKYAETQFDSRDVEMADGNSEFMRQLEDNHNVVNEEFEDATIFTMANKESTEDEYTTQSVSTTFESYDEFAEQPFHKHAFENSREIEDGRSNIVKQTEDDHFDINENEEINDANTLASIIEEEFTTQYSSMKFKDLDEIFYPTFDDHHNIKIDDDIENGYTELVSEHNEDSYSDFITPYPHIEMSDESEDAHFNQMNPDAISDLEGFENKDDLEYIRDFPRHESFEDYEVSNDKEEGDYSFIATEFSIPEMSSNIPHSEDEGNRFYLNHNTVIEPISDDSDTYESFSQQVSETLDVNKDNTITSQPLSNETDNKEQFSRNEEIKRNNMNSEIKQLRTNTSQNILFVESAHARADSEVATLINTEINEYLMDENTKDTFKVDLLNNEALENSSNKDILNEHYDSYNTLSDIDSKETEDFSQNESDIEAILHKFELNQPLNPGVLDKMELKSIENIDDEIRETSSFEDSEIDSEDLTKILDDLENYQNVAENDPLSHQEHVFNPKPDSDSKAMLENSSKITPGKTLSNIETSATNKDFSKLPQNNHGNTMKDKPIRIPRMFNPPYNRDFNFDKFSRDFNFDKLSSRNFAGVPYSLIQFKQKSMKKLLGSPVDSYNMKGVEHYYSTRTGDFLEYPKVSKLISIGKNLLNAKKAKLRILRRYVNY
ncbi:hypothetical protein JTE90_026269 [Oedothorax gibbosus]|uniref:Chitin-binding type-2 domain-containing protein n=1 Tax=Oedothorax gibbosus TaxID=931172 RepID=A0AAV6U2U0_9ARAC|nr:hypothetical protein JTE90_026269 [Oedothorax gibbosus]